MSKVINFPPKEICHVCRTELRRATKDEIREGLRSDDASTRQIFSHGVQGDTSKTVVETGILLASLEEETPKGSWVMICDSCGLVSACLPAEII